MNGSTKLSLAVALALAGAGNAFALGLGAIQVKSGLNQPLNAEIALITDSPAEAAGLNVSLAKAEDFQRVGLDRARMSIPLDFEVISNGRNPVIRVTTKDPVREPFLDFLVEANWAKGRVLREYTVLLDPPVMAPATKGSTATVAPAREAAPASSAQLPPPKAAKPAPAPKVKPPKAIAETAPKPAKPAPAPKPVPAPKPAPAAARTAGNGEYGPVAEGETLSEIARATKDDNTDTNGMMLALLQANPNAFYKDNINALKRGAILRIPSHDDVKAAGNAAAAAASVRDQNEAWKSGSAPVAKPTLVATTGEPKSKPAPTTVKSTAAKPSDGLALVPPGSAKGGQSTSDRPGSASGSGAGAAARGDAQRTKEALASREQEVGELKSRVKELEDINGKDQKLLTMRNSEIAELQSKLKELEAKGGTAATASKTPATTPVPSATPAPSTTTSTPSATKPADNTKITAQDIWGKISETDKPKTATSTPSATTPPSTTPTTTPSTTPSTTASSTTAPSSSATSTTPSTPTTTSAPSSSTTPPSASATPSSTTTPSTTASTTSSTTPAPTTQPTSTPATSTTPSSTTASTTTPPTSTAATPTSTPAALKPKPATSITPIAPEEPWYQNTMTLAIAGGALLLVGLLALMRFMRRPKPVLLNETDGDVLVEEPHQYAELPTESEGELLEALAQHPGDPELSLKLLRLYYAERDASKFEAAAEAMYAHIADPTQPEWQEVKAMGEDLVPHNPLFNNNDSLTDYMHESVAPVAHAQEAHLSDDNFDLGNFDADGTPAAAEENFDFDLADHSAHPVAPVVEHAAPVAAPATLVHAAKPAEDFFAGEDTIGTKLDLARAYLDMGDPEGARSMLDEVMSEGNETQKGEARKLLAEIK
jgi:pilus assembly protein FimV